MAESINEYKMQLFNKLFEVNITCDHGFTLNSTDNKHYDKVYNPFGFRKDDYLKVLSIEIKNVDSLKKIAIICSALTSEHDSAILKRDKLFLLLNDSIAVLNIETLIMEEQKHISECGSLFAIYQFDGGYIIHGEQEIIKIAASFDVEWSFSGADIFVYPDNKDKDFAIADDKIIVYDWNGTKYILNNQGELI